MRLAKGDAALALDAIRVSLESTQWKRWRRSEYNPPMDDETEKFVRAQEDDHDAALRALRDKIEAQMRG